MISVSASKYRAYALAAGVAGMGMVLQWLLLRWLKTDFLYQCFIPGLVLVVLSLGRGPGLLVLFWGFLVGVFITPSVGMFAIHSGQHLISVGIYALTGLLVVSFGTRLSFTTRRAMVAEQRLALAQKNTGVGIFELDFDAGKAFISPSLCQMLGLDVSSGEIDLDLWLGGLRADHVEESKQVMHDYLSRGEVRYEREQRIVRPDGQIRWVINRVELEADSHCLRVARGVAVDITERKRVEELLQQAQEGLQQQLQDVGRLHAFSQHLLATGDDLPAALQSLLDITLELYGARHGIVTIQEGIHGAFHSIAQAGFGDEAIEGQSGESIVEQHRALAALATLREVHSLPLRSADGEVMGFVSVMRADSFEQSERYRYLAEVCVASAAAIVERERARTAAARNEKRFTVALESSVVPFTILTPRRDGEGHIVDFVWTYVNPAAARALGREVNELIGQGVRQVLPNAWDAPGQFARYVYVLESNEQSEFEMQTRASNQGLRWYTVLAAPLQGSVAIWFTNITNRKKYEASLQEADRRKDEFLATLAHELRNPLAPIRQSVRIADSDKSTDAQRRWSHGIIERQIQHMSLLLDDLLDVSRIGRGTLLLRKSSELLSVVVETALEAARPHVEAKRHRLKSSLPLNPLILNIDPVRIAQVLGNILTNAAKYTDPGGEIGLSADHEADELVIRVKDNGIGLTQAQQSQVFEMFSQVPGALDHSQGGLGIGLSLARGLVELHGGTIHAVSAGLGQGTEIIVRLPGNCVLSETPDCPPLLIAPNIETQPHVQRCVLIADDNVDSADSLAELLRLEGYEVHVAYDGAAAMTTFARIAPDAALLDVGMPQISGLDLVRAIRQKPEGQNVTLIAVTGWGQERDRREALEAGFDHHLTKPIVPEKVFALIQRGRVHEKLPF